MTDEQREVLEFDVLFVGAGPGNLAGMIRLLTLARFRNMDIEVGMIDKGGSCGAHLLSGAVMDPVALKELIPDCEEKGCPIEETRCTDTLFYMTRNRAYSLPLANKILNSEGCWIVSLSKLGAWLGETAEGLGGNIFPGFAGVKVLFDPSSGAVKGVRTGDKGMDKHKKQKANFEPGIDIHAKVTVFGEGARGSLFRDLDEKLHLSPPGMPQIFKTSFKEVIRLPEGRKFPSGSNVWHMMGYPLEGAASGGGFVYRMGDDLLSLGLVVGLDYEDPCFEPHDAFLQFKHHPLIHDLIQGGKVLQQGAKTLPAGGLYAMPRSTFDGGLLVGDSAGVLNTMRLKGIHTAMKSGMLAAETIISAIEKQDFTQQTLKAYQDKIASSWIHKELFPARNFSQTMAKPLPLKMFHLAAQQVSRGRGIVDPMAIVSDQRRLAPVTNRYTPDIMERISPETDDKLFVDKLTGVFLSGTRHEEDQPCHLIIRDPDLCVTECADKFNFPCVRFCPGQVYETKQNADGKRELHLNPSNCLHCKTCEIKDPLSNILWTCPEGGGGPAYTMV